jgi:probable F420-dependent oxidoreductase
LRRDIGSPDVNRLGSRGKPEETAMDIGKLGVWMSQEGLSAADAATQAKRLEAWGYKTLWQPEAVGRNVLVHSMWLLAHTTKLNIATGIANIYARDPMACATAQLALAEASGGRFLLGLGVSHIPLVAGVRKHEYGKPVSTMRDYLNAMKAAPYMSVRPAEAPKTVIAALGPKMLELSGTVADGAHPYNVTPEHTARARQALPAGNLLCPEQMVLLETDPAKAREAGRKLLTTYLQLPNYRNNFNRIGFSADDFENGGSDRLIDSIIAWGDEAAIRRRIQAHWDAGADHVCIQSVPADGSYEKPVPEKIFELLAPIAG